MYQKPKDLSIFDNKLNNIRITSKRAKLKSATGGGLSLNQRATRYKNVPAFLHGQTINKDLQDYSTKRGGTQSARELEEFRQNRSDKNLDLAILKKTRNVTSGYRSHADMKKQESRPSSNQQMVDDEEVIARAALEDKRPTTAVVRLPMKKK